MSNVPEAETATDQLVDSAECPDWCEQEHLGQAESGFHHDGETTIIPRDHPVAPGDGLVLYVNVSQLVRAGAPSQLALVEVQDERRTLLLLSPAECLHLARSLLDGATTLAGDEPQRDGGTDELCALTAHLMESVDSLRAVVGPPVGSVAPSPRRRAPGAAQRSRRDLHSVGAKQAESAGALRPGPQSQ